MAAYWHKVPFVRFLLPLLLGISTSIFLKVEHDFVLLFFILFFCTAIVFHFVHFSLNKRWIQGLCINLALFCFGILLNLFQNELFQSNHFSYSKSDFLVVAIDEPIQEKRNTNKCVLRVLSGITAGNSLYKQSGNILAYFKKDSVSIKLKYGDCLIIKNNVTDISGPQNPYEFNYKRYLAFNQIHYQIYIDSCNYIKTGLKSEFFLYSFAYEVQDYFKDILNKYVRSKSEIGVAQALLFGYDDDIDSDILKAYSNTGTLHVLAVSGMHVGIIFVVFNYLLFFLEKKKQLRIIKTILLLLLIWFYSLLCGLSPSILRATVMLSFILLGKLLNRKLNIFNSLAVSAFFLILFNSNIIANVGFQLSYLAVIGIVFLQPKIYSLTEFNSWFGDNVWKIVSVSIAAQIATFPLGLLYFHQFPNVFLLSNLLIIPLTTVTLHLGLLLIGVSKFDFLANQVGTLLKWSIKVTNELVLGIERIPYSYYKGINISIAETVLIYFLFAFAISYLLLRRIGHLKIFLIVALMICTAFSAKYFVYRNNKSITIYNIKNHIALNVQNGSNSYFIADSVLLADKDKIQFHVQQHLWATGQKDLKIINASHRDNELLKVGNKRILLMTKNIKSNEAKMYDYIMFCGNIDFKLLDSIGNDFCNTIILNNDMSLRKRMKAKEKIQKLGIKLYDISEYGAFEVKL